MCRPTRYIMLGALFAFVVAYQVRASWKTVHVETNLDFYVPFTLARFTNRIDASWDSRLRSGYQIIAVNGHPFRGASLYFRELWESQHQAVSLRDASWRACVINVRDGDSRVRAVEVWPAHCTCGVPGKTEAVMFWLGLPLCCILIGFTTVLLRPGSRAAWAFLLLMLSLSQLRLFQDLYPGFQQTIDPMSWSDWMRTPSVAYRSFVQHAWTAALLVLARCLYRSRRRAHGITVAVVGVFIGYAVAQAILDVAWSENYRPF